MRSLTNFVGRRSIAGASIMAFVAGVVLLFLGDALEIGVVVIGLALGLALATVWSRLKLYVDRLHLSLAATEKRVRKVQTLVRDLKPRMQEVERRTSAHQSFNADADVRLQEVERRMSAHQSFNDAVLERVREVERRTSAHQSFNDAVLERVREVERRTSAHQSFNDAVLERVREAERRTSAHQSFNDAVLERVRDAERRIGPIENREIGEQSSTTQPGHERRVRKLRTLLRESSSSVTTVPDRTECECCELESPTALNDEQPLLSVVVTCYNQQDFIRQTLESVRGQTYGQFECLVVDDCSTDGSLRAIQSVADVDDRFRVLTSDQNQGACVARNAGLAQVEGRFVTFLDGDDLLLRESLENRYSVIESSRDTDCAGSYSGFWLVDEAAVLGELPAAIPRAQPARLVDFVSAQAECPFGTPGPLMRTDVARGVGGWSTDWTMAADWEFWLRVMRQGFFFEPTDSTTIAYRQLSSSQSQSSAVRHVETGHELIEAAYAPVELDLEALRGSIVFDEPLDTYEREITKARRSIQFAAMLLLLGQPEGFRNVIADLKPGTWPLIDRHVEIERHATDGFRRAAGLFPSDLSEIRDELIGHFHAVRVAVYQRSK